MRTYLNHLISLATKRNIATEYQTARCWQWSQRASLIKPVESHGHSCVGCGLELCNANNDDDKLANLSLFLESAQNATHLQAQKTEPVGTVANKGETKRKDRERKKIYLHLPHRSMLTMLRWQDIKFQELMNLRQLYNWDLFRSKQRYMHR